MDRDARRDMEGFEIEGIPEDEQRDGIFVPDGKGRPIRLEVPDDDD